MCIVDLSRLLSKRRVIALAVAVCAAQNVLAITDCELAKAAISNEVRNIQITVGMQSQSIHSYLDPLSDSDLVWRYWNGDEYVTEELNSMVFYNPSSGGGDVGSVPARVNAVLYQFDNYTNHVLSSCNDTL